MTNMDDARHRYAAATDALFAHCRADTPGCAVGIVQHGELAFAKGYGSADLDHGVPLTPHSVFYIASVAKQFTAAAMLRLVVDGALSLDDELSRHFPELPDYARSITPRHLLHHTSGLRDYLTLRQLAGLSFEDHFDNDWALAMIARQRNLDFAPGKEFGYSNSNYVLLAELVMRVSGQSLQAFCEQQFFDPLGMSQTRWGAEPHAVIPHRVTSYRQLAGGRFRRMVQNFAAFGDGNLLTTVHDLARWDAAMYDHSPRWRPLVELMLARGVLASGETLSYAGGLEHSAYREVPTIEHGGGMLGFRTHLLRMPTERLTVIFLSNVASENARARTRQLADIWQFGELAVNRPPPLTAEPASAAPIDATALDAMAGIYREPEAPHATLIVERDGGGLKARFAGVTVTLTPTAPDTFQAAHGPMPMQLRRVPTDDGTRRVEVDVPERHLVLDAASVGDAVDAAPGRYVCDEIGAVWTIAREAGDRLLLHGAAPFGESVRLYAVGADELISSEWRLLLERDEDDMDGAQRGRVRGLLIDAGRVRALRFRRC
jgi:CubicO group peptidase (beta-lactamase class C family)